MMITAEKCFLCGELVDVGDLDTIQVHGGENGLCHESCWLESDASGEGSNDQE
ncbi:MAG: hypothetical protein WCA27_30105 [Candidatus Sulfotelmatobacter sp.]